MKRYKITVPIKGTRTYLVYGEDEESACEQVHEDMSKYHHKLLCHSKTRDSGEGWEIKEAGEAPKDTQ